MKRITKIEQNGAGSLAVSKLRVAAYCRVSTASDDQLVSLEAQKTHYESYILVRHLLDIGVFVFFEKENLNTQSSRCRTRM